MADNKFKSGFISVVGSPNVGKSTIVNSLTGQKVSIVSEKPQTTRNTIKGILTKENMQMVFLDTPGIFEPKNKLQKYMVKKANQAARDVDAVLFVADALAGIKKRDNAILDSLLNSDIPVAAAINKTDKAKKEDIGAISKILVNLDIKEVIPISALYGDGMNKLLSALEKYLPCGPMYYPEDIYTDKPERFIAAEMIREKALMLLSEEVPHGTAVEIEKMEKRESKDLTYISAVIYCEKKSHKGIIIGAKGAMLKKIGSMARADIEMLIGNKVFLEIFVKVREDWRNSGSILKELGYE